MIYELITPSDPITFKANDDKIAYACALYLGNGKAGCENKETGESLPTMLMFSEDPEKKINDFLGMGIIDFVKKNKHEMGECFLSFAYGNLEDRKSYDDAIEAITDPEKLEEFKEKHEDRRRSSMSEWVNVAWSYGMTFTSQNGGKTT